MKTFVEDVLKGQGDNYIFPFFWQHGESEDVLREYMKVIHESNIGAVCVEARPHPDFAGPRWWHDMDIILDEARKRNMKVWILDDAHFPTGYANGLLPQKEDSLCKQYLAYNCADIYGPVAEASLHVAELAHYAPTIHDFVNPIFDEQNPRKFDDDQLFAVVAARVLEGDTVSRDTVVLTDKVKDGWLEWDAPEGVWRIFVFYLTRNGGGKTNYINMLDADSCHVQIEAVYEPHYAHYKDDFGKTIAGFFSDEPAVGNTKGFSFDESIGRKKMHLPWNKDMNAMMEERLGKDYVKVLPALWTAMDDDLETGRTRYGYMDAVTELISKSFSGQIGKWCEDHGVEYIGHIVEDGGQHSRLGSSMGHFFRAMKGQHMAGIDDIGNQVIPGGDYNRRLDGFAKGGQGEFFHFELGKLGSSYAHIDPKKQGRAMCEIFGAYGWNTGVKTMKYLADHFLVQGLNYFVPHAFSPKTFPDPDCPPHFYAHGENPQYRHFGKLMAYMNRMCHLFNHGRSVVQAALLYHGEAEWSGGYMFDQKPARELMEHQIDFDIVPADVFAFGEYFNTGLTPAGEKEGMALLEINGNTYKALVLPYSQFITQAVARFIIKAQKEGFPVVFVDGRPEGICDVPKEMSADLMREMEGCGCVAALCELAGCLQGKGVCEISLDQSFKRFRYYHYVQDQAHIYMFFNGDPGQCFDGTVTVSAAGPAFRYDVMENRMYKADVKDLGGENRITLKLAPGESAVFIFDECVDNLPEFYTGSGRNRKVEGPWQVSLCETKQYPDFKPLAVVDELHDIGRLARDFSGFIRYENTFTLSGDSDLPEKLVIDQAYEGVEVWVNDSYAGMVIAPPYVFDIKDKVKTGENTLRIEVATTLYRKVSGMEDKNNPFRNPPIVQEPIGIIGDVRACVY